MDRPWLPPGLELRRLVAVGEPGELWEARRSDGAAVAVRWLPGVGAEVRAELRRIAAVTGTLRDVHVLPTYDVIDAAGGIVVVRPFVAHTVTELVAGRTLTAGQVVTVVAPVATALDALHARGLAHGRVHPGNVTVGASGRPWLADVGLAAAVAGCRPDPAADVSALRALALDLAERATDGARLAAALRDLPDGPVAVVADVVLRSHRAEPLSGQGAAPPPPVTPSRRGSLARPLLTLAVVAVLVTTGIALLPLPGPRAAPSGHVRPVTTPRAAPDWHAVVAGLERRRLAAYRRVDPTLLRRVYLATSPARDTDAAILDTWARRGWRPDGLRCAVSAVRMVSAAGEEARVRATLAVSAFRLRDAAGRIASTVRRAGRGSVELVLRRLAGRWRIAAVRPLSRRVR